MLRQVVGRLRVVQSCQSVGGNICRRNSTISPNHSRRLFGDVVLRRCPEQESIHGPPHWSTPLQLVSPIKPCGYEQFNLDPGNVRLRHSHRSRFHVLPCSPPWWSRFATDLPEGVPALLAELKTGKWDTVSECLSPVVRSVSSRSFTLWELLMWQAVRFGNSALAETVSYYAGRQLNKLPSRLGLLRSLALARNEMLDEAIKMYLEASWEAADKAAWEYVTANLAACCLRGKYHRLLHARFSASAGMLSPGVSDHVQSLLQQYEVANDDLLRYALGTRNIDLLVLYLSATQQVTGTDADAVLTKIAPRVFSRPQVAQLYSEVIINGLVVHGRHQESKRQWGSLVFNGMSLSVRCTSAVLGSLLRDKKGLDLPMSVTVMRSLHKINFRNASDADLCELLSMVGRLQAVFKNQIVASHPFSPAIWKNAMENILCFDWLKMLVAYDVPIDLNVLRAKYSMTAIDLPVRQPELLDSVRTHGFQFDNRVFWHWCNALAAGIYPRSCFETVNEVGADVKKLSDFDTDVNIMSVSAIWSHRQGRNSLEAEFVAAQLEEMQMANLLSSGNSFRGIVLLLKGGVNTLEHIALFVAALENMQAKGHAVPPPLLEEILKSIAPQDPTLATPEHAEAAKSVWAVVSKDPQLCATEQTVHYLLMAVAKHNQHELVGLLKTFSKFKLPIPASTVFILAKAAALERWALLPAEEIVFIARQLGVQFSPFHGSQLQSIVAHVKPPSGLQRVRAVLGVLKSAKNRSGREQSH